MQLSMETNDDESKIFFDAITSNNVAEIRRIFKDESTRPWEYTKDENSTGIIPKNI